MKREDVQERGDAELSVVLELGVDGAETMPVVLRPLRSQDDYQQCEEVERETWGQDFSECVPGSILMISQKVGGVAAGAFDSDGRLVGMVYGLTGPRQGRLVHWSHMLAVRNELRGRGLGRELKMYQRRVVLEKGAESMLWTYDPLVARNAALNINRLGARPVEYIRDLYGPDTASELHSGLGTDRFVVEWRLEREPPTGTEDLHAWSSAAVINRTPEADLHVDSLEPRDAPFLRIEVPSDIQQIKRDDPEAGGRWRASTRLAFETCFSEGYVIEGFDVGVESGFSWYLLRQGDLS